MADFCSRRNARFLSILATINSAAIRCLAVLSSKKHGFISVLLKKPAGWSRNTPAGISTKVYSTNFFIRRDAAVNSL
jgi:hypothetical protein